MLEPTVLDEDTLKIITNIQNNKIKFSRFLSSMLSALVLLSFETAYICTGYFVTGAIFSGSFLAVIFNILFGVFTGYTVYTLISIKLKTLQTEINYTNDRLTSINMLDDTILSRKANAFFKENPCYLESLQEIEKQNRFLLKGELDDFIEYENKNENNYYRKLFFGL